MPGSAPQATGAQPAPAATTQPCRRAQRVTLVAEGGLVDVARALCRLARHVREIAARSVATPVRTWVRARDVRGSVFWSGGPLRVAVEPGSAQALGAELRWSRVDWRAGEAGAPARLDVQATVDAFPVAPALKTLQPTFGWGGDLAVGARINVRSTPEVVVDVVVERRSGDLTVSDEIGTQALGFTDLRLGIAAEGGVWHFTTAAAGTALGVVAGAVTARTSAQTSWPDASTPIEGVLELRVASLGAWGPWVPAGWRLSGDLHAGLSIGGRLGAPQYTGRLEGSGIGVRTSLKASTHDGRMAIAPGTTRASSVPRARRRRHVRLEGDAVRRNAVPACSSRSASDARPARPPHRHHGTRRCASTRTLVSTKVQGRRGLVDSALVAPRLGDDVVSCDGGGGSDVGRGKRSPSATPTRTSRRVDGAPDAERAVAHRSGTRRRAVRARRPARRMGENMRVRGRVPTPGCVASCTSRDGGRLAVNGSGTADANTRTGRSSPSRAASSPSSGRSRTRASTSRPCDPTSTCASA